MHQATQRFWKSFNKLPKVVQNVAREKFELLKSDPRHPSLHLKKVGEFWSARVGIAHRALAVKDEEGFTWVWIGTHDEYQRIINS